MRTAFFDVIRFRPGWLGVAVGLGVWFSLCSAPALAADEPHPFVTSFGRSATETFSNPNGIAVDEATGEVYVADIGTDAIYKFDANGSPVSFSALGRNELKGGETPGGSFSFPSLHGTPAAIAVDNACMQHTPALTGKACEEFDPSAGDLYVMDDGHGVIDKFSPEGNYLSQIAGFAPAIGSTENELLGLGVDAAGTLHVELKLAVAINEYDDSSTNHLIAKQISVFGGSGSSGVPGTTPEAYGFAVGPTGDDYPIYESCSCTVKLGQQLAGLGKLDSDGSGDVAVATDPESGHVYVDDQSSVGEWDTGRDERGS